jgi:SsrA-binding protein
MPKPIATNKKAYRDFFFTETYECGVELGGAEVKSVRAGFVNFKDAFARVEDQQVFLYNLHIDPYPQASYMNLLSDRPRRMLLHKRQILKLWNESQAKRLALIPTKIYFNDRGKCKIELALGRGKKVFDKRETVKKREIDRSIGRTLRSRR